MTILDLNEDQLIRNLEQLPRPLRVIFAATCAERLLPAYLNFSDLTEGAAPETLTRALARLWEDIDGNPMTEDEVQSNVSACMALIPPDDDMSLPVESAYGEDADVAVIYALTCLQNGSSQDAMWAARRVTDSIYHFVSIREDVFSTRRGALKRELAHPLIQAELARQRRDIDELLGAAEADADVRQTAERFRERAKGEAGIVFGVPS
jgi:uncharacterized protein YjaG (DUF416 family)